MNYGRLCVVLWLAVACSEEKQMEPAGQGTASDADGTKLGAPDAALAESATASSAESAAGTKDSGAPIYCGLETRDHQLWLHYGTEKRLYTVKTRDGQTVLASEIDDERLKRDFPDLHEKVHQGVDALMDDAR